MQQYISGLGRFQILYSLCRDQLLMSMLMLLLSEIFLSPYAVLSTNTQKSTPIQELHVWWLVVAISQLALFISDMYPMEPRAKRIVAQSRPVAALLCGFLVWGSPGCGEFEKSKSLPSNFSSIPDNFSAQPDTDWMDSMAVIRAASLLVRTCCVSELV